MDRIVHAPWGIVDQLRRGHRPPDFRAFLRLDDLHLRGGKLEHQVSEIGNFAGFRRFAAIVALALDAGHEFANGLAQARGIAGDANGDFRRRKVLQFHPGMEFFQLEHVPDMNRGTLFQQKERNDRMAIPPGGVFDLRFDPGRFRGILADDDNRSLAVIDPGSDLPRERLVEIEGRGVFLHHVAAVFEQLAEGFDDGIILVGMRNEDRVGVFAGIRPGAGRLHGSSRRFWPAAASYQQRDGDEREEACTGSCFQRMGNDPFPSGRCRLPAIGDPLECLIHVAALAHPTGSVNRMTPRKRGRFAARTIVQTAVYCSRSNSAMPSCWKWALLESAAAAST